MIRISNIEKSLNFYCKGLGLKETRRKENEKGKAVKLERVIMERGTYPREWKSK